MSTRHDPHKAQVSAASIRIVVDVSFVYGSILQVTAPAADRID